MKPCPYCTEEIQDATIVCKHCGRELATGFVQVEAVRREQPKDSETPRGDKPGPRDNGQK